MSRLIETERLELRPMPLENAASVGAEGGWAVHRRDNGTAIGTVSLQFVPRGGESLGIDFSLDPGARGNGYAAEAGDALIRWAIHVGGVAEVFAVVPAGNTHGSATAQRIGMDLVGDRGPFHIYRIRHGDLEYED